MFLQSNQPVPPNLDELLKSVLDTLSTSDNIVGPTGTLVVRNDTYVTESQSSSDNPPVLRNALISPIG